MDKIISFVIPCFNSAAYMDVAIRSVLALDEAGVASGSSDIELIIVDDGSFKDATSQKADEWQSRYPGIVRAIHQENGGHGQAINTGLAATSGLYFKVLDSDDWLDRDAGMVLLRFLRTQRNRDKACDLVITNYVYEKPSKNTRRVMSYRNAISPRKEITWEEVKRFRPSQYLLMHSVIYRSDLLRESGLTLPTHCFYVDNLFVYVPLPFVDTLYYLDLDLYRYYIGREDQSVNEKVMLGRIEQQLRVTRLMIDAVKMPDDCVEPSLRRYMLNYLSMMMCICTVFLRMRGDAQAERWRSEIWDYLSEHNPGAAAAVRHRIINRGTNLPGRVGKAIGLTGYHAAQRLFKFN